MKRFSVLSMMAAIALVGLGLAAMRDGSELAEMLSVWILYLSLAVGLVGVVVRRSSPGWVGFLAFAGLYTITGFVLVQEDEQPTNIAARRIGTAFNNRQSLRAKFGLEPYLEEFLFRLYKVPPMPPDPPFFFTTENGELRKVTWSKGLNGVPVISQPTKLTSDERKMHREREKELQIHFTRLRSVQANIQHA